jgi:hypothetical protein
VLLIRKFRDHSNRALLAVLQETAKPLVLSLNASRFEFLQSASQQPADSSAANSVRQNSAFGGMHGGAKQVNQHGRIPIVER